MASRRVKSQSTANATRLWKEYFRDPSQWWDNRSTKCVPGAPDFRHKTTGEALWLDGPHNPHWVQDFLKLTKQKRSCEVEERTHKSSSRCVCLDELALKEDDGLCVQPSLQDFASSLKRCEHDTSHTDLFCPQDLLKRTSFVFDGLPPGNDGVSNLVYFGNMSHSLDTTVCQDAIQWDTLISNCLKADQPFHALSLYDEMQQKQPNRQLNNHTYVALLKTCTKLKDLERGIKIHSRLTGNKVLENDVYINSTLVHMYAKCGSMAKAQELFNNITVRDVVLWTALIGGYVENCQSEEAVVLFQQMQKEKVPPDRVTYVCILKAYGNLGATEQMIGELFNMISMDDTIFWNALISGYVEQGYGKKALKYYREMQHKCIPPNIVTFSCAFKACSNILTIPEGRKLHAETVMKGFETDSLIGSTLVDMYAKSGLILEAEHIFHVCPVQETVTWNALMLGLTEHGYNIGTVKSQRRMQVEGVSLDSVSIICFLKACGSTRDTERLHEIHCVIFCSGLETDIAVGSSLIDAYSKCGLVRKALEVFEKLPKKDVISWNAMITGYIEHRCHDEAINCYECLQQDGIAPHITMFACILKACSGTGSVLKGQEIHIEVTKKGLENGCFIGSSLVDMYAKCGHLEAAQEVFDRLSDKDVVNCNSLITGYLDSGFADEALNVFEQMQHWGISPDDFTFACILRASGALGIINITKTLHIEITRRGLEKDIFIGSTLVDAYCKCGLPSEAQRVFTDLPIRDVVAWTALIAGYGLQLGEIANVIYNFEEMVSQGIEPNFVTYICLLNSFSHEGLVDKGQKCFGVLKHNTAFLPTLEHHNCFVDLLARAGGLGDAVTVTEKMSFLPSTVIWQTLLGGCWKWQNIELGKSAFAHAVRLNKNNVAAYVCMSNMYADGDLFKVP